ncbi:MAG: hypothetical protein AAB490_03565 [Patescibacteria group bacterium]
METGSEYHATVYLNSNPMMGRLFKVVASGEDQARDLALKEAKVVLFHGLSSSDLKKAKRVLAKSDVVIGRPGHGCACAECDQPLSRTLAED